MLSKKTLLFIMTVLNQKMNNARTIMMQTIDSGAPIKDLENCITEYRSSRSASLEFAEWMQNQHEGDGDA